MRKDQSATAPSALSDLSTAATVLTGIAVVAALYLAGDVLIPLAMSILVSFALAPAVDLLRRSGIPRMVAVLTVVALTFGLILGVGALGTAQIAQLAEDLPRYQSNIRDKIRSLKETLLSEGKVSRATAVIDDLGAELADADPSQPAIAASPSLVPSESTAAAEKPVPVEIKPSSNNPFAIATEFLRAIVSPLVDTFLVLLFVVFFLLQQRDLRDRVIRLLGPRELHRTTEAMQEAAQGLSTYFLLQTAINAAAGSVIGLGLWVIGVPSPLLWGVFAMLLRFVPYAGPVLAAILPVVLAASLDHGWSMVLWTAGLYLATEAVTGQLVEPLVFGRKTGLSPVATMVAAIFWTWLWGPVGLIMSIPLTLCLVIIGQHTQRLEFLHVLLGDQPPLTPSQSFYQRLIAGDPAEIIDQAERQLQDVELAAYLEDVALPALALAQRDVGSGELSTERQLLVLDGVKELIDGLPALFSAEASAVERTAERAASIVLCIGGRGAINQAAAALLAHQLQRDGIAAETGNEQGIPALATSVDGEPPAPLVCLVYVGEVSAAQARYNVRRIRRQFTETPILVGLWQIPLDHPEVVIIKQDAGADFVTATLRETIGVCRQQTIDMAAPVTDAEPTSLRLPLDQLPSVADNQRTLLSQEV